MSISGSRVFLFTLREIIVCSMLNLDLVFVISNSLYSTFTNKFSQNRKKYLLFSILTKIIFDTPALNRLFVISNSSYCAFSNKLGRNRKKLLLFSVSAIFFLTHRPLIDTL